jgi:hypothetical protein
MEVGQQRFRVKETFDADEIRRVMCDPEIFERISSDGTVNAEDWYPTINENDRWLAAYVNGELAGVLNTHPSNPVCWEGHIQILKPYRRYAHPLFTLALDWAWQNTQAEKIVVQIPAIHLDVIEFVQAHGFLVEGVNTRSIKKYGVLLDQIHMGLERVNNGES